MHFDLMFDSEVVVPMHLCLANVAVVVWTNGFRPSLKISQA